MRVRLDRLRDLAVHLAMAAAGLGVAGGVVVSLAGGAGEGWHSTADAGHRRSCSACRLSARQQVLVARLAALEAGPVLRDAEGGDVPAGPRPDARRARFTIERFEGEAIAVLSGRAGVRVDFPRAFLPETARPGDVLMLSILHAAGLAPETKRRPPR
jgi:hypothetical protein